MEPHHQVPDILPKVAHAEGSEAAAGPNAAGHAGAGVNAGAAQPTAAAASASLLILVRTAAFF